MTRKHEGVGDGDVCPLNPEHGQMMFLSGSANQWCPGHSHDMDMTRAFWPKGHDSFHRAVIAATMHPIDITLKGD